jgi:hypothetical protein
VVCCVEFDRAKVIFFSPDYTLPFEVYEEPLINRDLIE